MLTEKSMELLTEIVTQNGLGQKVYCDKRAQPLVEAGLIAVDMNDQNPNDELEFACVPTEEGLKIVGVESPKQMDLFEIDKNVPMPKVVRRTSTKYPFDKLVEIETDSFHIPQTDDNKDPVKRVASAVNAASKRYLKEDGRFKKFAVRRVGEDDPKGPGCRVYRVK